MSQLFAFFCGSLFLMSIWQHGLYSRVTLSHSRKGYSEVVWRQTTNNFITAIENALHFFGGVPSHLDGNIELSHSFDHQLNDCWHEVQNQLSHTLNRYQFLKLSRNRPDHR